MTAIKDCSYEDLRIEIIKSLECDEAKKEFILVYRQFREAVLSGSFDEDKEGWLRLLDESFNKLILNN